jgi:PAS domain S-box-containing protein
MINNDTHEQALVLRRRAEEMVRGQGIAFERDSEAALPEETQRMIQELRVHQIELELQNDELRRTQTELDAARARYFDLYELAPVGYCTLSVEGWILEANLTAVTLLGVTRSALLHQPITRFILGEDQDIYYLFRKHLDKDGSRPACDLRMVRNDGAPVWVHMMATAALEPPTNEGQMHEGKPVIRITLSDITELRLAEAEKSQLEARLQEAKKLETLGVIAGGVAHDFNNLLAAIMGFANLGSMAVASKGDPAPFLAGIEKASMRAADLTRQLLAYAGKGKYVLTEMDLDILIKEVIQILSVSIPKNVEFRCELADRLPFVMGDSAQILQVLMNLITNASESFEEGQPGLITVMTLTELVEEPIAKSDTWILPLASGRYSTLEVIDTGKGMTPEVLARIFEPFFTTKFTGRGLGLSAVMGILGGHGGGLRVISAPGLGSSFKIYLPAMRGARSHPPGESMPVWRGEGRLLLVDDDPEVRRMARGMAEHLGFSVVEAQSGQEAIDLFTQYHSDLVLVLLDLSMPCMNGLEAFEEIRAIDDRVPVVLSSGFDVHETDLFMDGLAGFLKKPYRVAEFQAVLQRTVLTKSDLPL